MTTRTKWRNNKNNGTHNSDDQQQQKTSTGGLSRLQQETTQSKATIILSPASEKKQKKANCAASHGCKPKSKEQSTFAACWAKQKIKNNHLWVGWRVEQGKTTISLQAGKTTINLCSQPVVATTRKNTIKQQNNHNVRWPVTAASKTKHNHPVRQHVMAARKKTKTTIKLHGLSRLLAKKPKKQLCILQLQGRKKGVVRCESSSRALLVGPYCYQVLYGLQFLQSKSISLFFIAKIPYLFLRSFYEQVRATCKSENNYGHVISLWSLVPGLRSIWFWSFRKSSPNDLLCYATASRTDCKNGLMIILTNLQVKTTCKHEVPRVHT